MKISYKFSAQKFTFSFILSSGPFPLSSKQNVAEFLNKPVEIKAKESYTPKKESPRLECLCSAEFAGSPVDDDVLRGSFAFGWKLEGERRKCVSCKKRGSSSKQTESKKKFDIFHISEPKIA